MNYEHFMVYELENTGERVRLDISENEFRENNGKNILDSNNVFVIVYEGIRRIYIWNGFNSPVRKKFIASRVAADLQSELVTEAHFHRCKVVSVDEGDEPKDFLNAFGFKSNDFDESERIQPDFSNSQTFDRKNIHEWRKPPPSLKSMKETPKVNKEPFKKPEKSKTSINLEIVKKRIIENDLPKNFKRQNLILGDLEIYGAITKKAKVFGSEVEETEWEPVNSTYNGVIELENRNLRLYFNNTTGKVEGLEILQKIIEEPKKILKEKEETPVNYTSWTVKQLKEYCVKHNIKVPSSYKKAQIISIVKGEEPQNLDKVDDYNRWTVKELKEYCTKNDLKVPSSYRKADIINLIKEATKEI